MRGARQTDADEVDVLVLGSGGAGLTAALVCATEGLKVLVCEKSAKAGGTTATSGGSLWVPGAPQVLQATPEVDGFRARQYLSRELGAWLRQDMLDAFLESSPEAIEFLDSRSEVKLAHATNPDYHADAPFGSATGHAITAVPFDARLLGADFARLRPPRDIFMVLGGMMVGRREIPILLRPFSSLANFRRTLGLLLRHARDRLRYPRGTRLLIGNALIARYLYSLQQLRVPIHYETRLLELVREGNRIIGAMVQEHDRRRFIRARRGVFLATGGISHNRALLQGLAPAWPHDLSMVDENDTGDGVAIARKAGAACDTEVVSPAYWSPGSLHHRPDGRSTLWIHGHMDRGKPGLLAVNQSGLRFVNEADSYHDFVLAMFADQDGKRNIPAYLVCDHKFIRQYGLGLVRPVISRIGPFVRDGYLHKADTLEALAQQIGVDPQALRSTVDTYNDDARTGVDTLFGRGSRVLNRFNGDSDNKPNPCMSPMVNAPFYALQIWPCTIGSTLGLATDADARVRDEQGHIIEGLYACGNDMTSVFRGFYPGPGATLGAAVVFAYRAARHVIDQARAPAQIL